MINYTDLARIMLREAGFPELAPFVQKSRMSGHFLFKPSAEEEPSFEKSRAVKMAWHLVHIVYCRTQEECCWTPHHEKPTNDSIWAHYDSWKVCMYGY